MLVLSARVLTAFLLSGAFLGHAQEAKRATQKLPNGEVSSRSFVDQSALVSQFTVEQYAHQSSLRIVQGIGYAVYQCNEKTPDENKAGQVARMAIFNILNPTATARWVDIAAAGEASNGITLGGTFVSAPMLYAQDDKTLHLFHRTVGGGQGAGLSRLLQRL